jgi:hypothetical protein
LRGSSQPTPPHPQEEELLSNKLKRALAGANARIAGLHKTVDVLQLKVRTLQKTISEKSAVDVPVKSVTRVRSRSMSSAGTRGADIADSGNVNAKPDEFSEDFRSSVRNLSTAFDEVSEPEEKAPASSQFRPSLPVHAGEDTGHIATLLTGLGPRTIVPQPSHPVSVRGPSKPKPTPIPLHDSWPGTQVTQPQPRPASAPRKRPPSSSHTAPK